MRKQLSAQPELALDMAFGAFVFEHLKVLRAGEDVEHMLQLYREHALYTRTSRRPSRSRATISASGWPTSAYRLPTPSPLTASTTTPPLLLARQPPQSR